MHYGRTARTRSAATQGEVEIHLPLIVPEADNPRDPRRVRLLNGLNAENVTSGVKGTERKSYVVTARRRLTTRAVSALALWRTAPDSRRRHRPGSTILVRRRPTNVGGALASDQLPPVFDLVEDLHGLGVELSEFVKATGPRG